MLSLLAAYISTWLFMKWCWIMGTSWDAQLAFHHPSNTFIGTFRITLCRCKFCFLWVQLPSINKTEPRCRVTTTLLTIWVSQLVLFQHHVTADQRVPISLAGVVTWPRRTASQQVPPTYWFLSMQFPASSSSSSNLNPVDSGLLYQPISVYTLSILNTTTVSTGTAHGSHPIPQLPPNNAGKIINSHSLQPATEQLHISNICIMWQILSAIRPPSPSVWRPCVISILSKSPKIVSFFYPALL